MNYGSFKVFYEGSLREELEKRKAQLCKEVANADEYYILQVNESNYVGYLVEKHRVACPEILFGEASAEKIELNIPAEHFPRTAFHVARGKSYRRPVIRYYLPITGDTEMLRLQPSTHQMMTYEMEIRDGCICFEVVDFYGDAENIKREKDDRTRLLEVQLGHLRDDVSRFDEGLLTEAEQAFRKRKNELLKQNEVMAALEVPIREKQGLSKTFSVPTPTDRHEVAIRPEVTEAGFEPHPTIDSVIYEKILVIIRDLLRVMEQHPSIYEDRDEEALRDQILLYLTPRFEWEATGETFNRKGKTDILVRYEGANLFAAECKFWRGAKAYEQGLDQLLGYLTWRDSKAAMVVFVDNKDISNVIDQIKIVTPQHGNCLSYKDSPDDSWLNYRFHIPGDANCEVRLAVLICHVPEVS